MTKRFMNHPVDNGTWTGYATLIFLTIVLLGITVISAKRKSK